MFGRYFKIFLPILTGLALVLSVAVNFGQQAQVRGGNNNNNHDEVTICHATGSQSNPYVQITVDDDAVDGNEDSDHNRNGHQNGEDIIPPGFWDFDGRNWDTQGQAIWNNDCNIPESSPSPSSSPEPSPSPEPCLTEVDPEWFDNDEDWDWDWWDDDDDWDHRPSPTPCPSPSPEPSPESSPEPSPTPPPVGGGPEVGGQITTPSCPQDRPQQVDQVWFSDIKPGEVTVHWANKGDAWGFQIAYGPSKDNLIWGVEVADANANQFTLKSLPAGDLWVSVIAKSSKECGGPTSSTFKVGAVGGQVLGVSTLGATGIAQTALLSLVGFGLIATGLWQAQNALARRGSKKA